MISMDHDNFSLLDINIIFLNESAFKLKLDLKQVHLGYEFTSKICKEQSLIYLFSGLHVYRCLTKSYLLSRCRVGL